MAQKSILVIDDEADFIDAVKMRLEPSGYDVIAAYNGQDGLGKAKKELPKVILLDLVMPKMNGFEVLSLLRADPRTSLIPVIMITGQSDIEYLFDAGKLGATEYIVKPVNMENLLELISKYA